VVMHVMLVHSEIHHHEMIVQRVGLGQIYLKKWSQAKRKFQTLILE
jgi:hypothetical protein